MGRNINTNDNKGHPSNAPSLRILHQIVQKRFFRGKSPFATHLAKHKPTKYMKSFLDAKSDKIPFGKKA